MDIAYSRKSIEITKVNVVEMRAVRSMCGVTFKDKMRYNIARERCSVKDDVVIEMKKECFNGSIKKKGLMLSNLT